MDGDESPAAKLASTKPRRATRSIAVRHTARLRERRMAMRLTMVDVCQAIGAGPSELSRWERGGEITLSRAFRIAVFFGCRVEDLWQPLTPSKELA